jgi:hypothetical protein
MSSERTGHRYLPLAQAMFSLIALAGCGDTVVDATSPMDAGLHGRSSSGGRDAGGAHGGAANGGAANAGAPGDGSGGSVHSGGAPAHAGSGGDAGSAGRGAGGGSGGHPASSGGASGGGNGGAPSDAGTDETGGTPGTGGMSATVECTHPVFTTSDTNGGWSDGGYYVHNNMWNSSAGLGPETLYACSYHNWYVVSNQTNNAGAVKTYPNVHKDYANVPISSFKTITSTFAATSPHVGIYNVAYDIWTNGVATAGSTEIMIWTENYKQVPAGSRAATVTLGGRIYDVWKTSNNRYIAFVPKTVFTSGSIDILELFRWTMDQGYLPMNSTLGQLDFGVEIVETGGGEATFRFTDFSITSTM